MTMRINGEEIESTFEIWSVKRKSTDAGEPGSEIQEIAFESEDDARLDQHFYGGALWMRTCFASVGHEEQPSKAEDLRV